MPGVREGRARSRVQGARPWEGAGQGRWYKMALRLLGPEQLPALPIHLPWLQPRSLFSLTV